MVMKKSQAFNLIEIMAVLSISLVLAMVGWMAFGNMLRQQQVLDASRMVKSNFVMAKARAIENTAPVYFKLSDTGTELQMLAKMSQLRDSNFDTTIIGEKNGTARSLGNHVSLGLPDGMSALKHWSSGDELPAFNDNSFYIQSNGLVLSTDKLEPTSGVYYFYNTTNTNTAAAVYITTTGSVKTAIALKDGKGVWNAWKYLN